MDTGDRVVLDCDDTMLDVNDSSTVEDWQGMTGTILKSKWYDMKDHYRIQPDRKRPDGEGTEWFYWPIRLINKAD